MRALFSSLIALLLACNAEPEAIPAPPAPAPPVAAPGPSASDEPAPNIKGLMRLASAVPTDAQLKERAHAFLDAYDRADEAAFLAPLGATFALLDGGEVQERDALLEKLRKRNERQAAPRTRTWLSEQTRISPYAAIFIGEAVEHFPDDAKRHSRDVTAWNTLVFAAQRGEFRLMHWQWELSGVDAARAYWNSEFLGKHDFSERPNQLLVDSVRGVKPGAALDLACGEGRNAVFLASQGWSTTGVDISDVALRLARDQAAQRKLKLELVEADVAAWDFGRARWDLVSLVYAGPAMTVPILEKVRASLKPGGLLVVEGFAPEPNSRAPDATVGGKLQPTFSDGFEVLKDELVDDIADWGLAKHKLVRFVARKRL